MREIKFRGMTAKGEMVHGSLSPDLPNSTMYYSDYSQRICWFPETGGQSNAPVKNGTVGQYTGLMDNEGVDIYEGDIVFFDGEPLKCIIDTDGVWFENDNVTMRKDDFKKYGEPLKIAGNIHESPELLT